MRAWNFYIQLAESPSHLIFEWQTLRAGVSGSDPRFPIFELSGIGVAEGGEILPPFTDILHTAVHVLEEERVGWVFSHLSRLSLQDVRVSLRCRFSCCSVPAGLC